MDRIYSVYRVENWFYVHKLNPIAQFLRGIMRILFSADVPPQMRIGKGTEFPHDALGCVFHPNAIIGRNCKILHGVTMGGRGSHIGLPVLGDDALVGTHAQILGNVKIGDHAIIGAGSIVINDVPKNAVVVGNPAKIIKWRE